MDDFGTGQSGIKQLLGLDLDILKIDKSQVDPLMKDPTADRLLRAVVALAAALRVKVVADGRGDPRAGLLPAGCAASMPARAGYGARR